LAARLRLKVLLLKGDDGCAPVVQLLCKVANKRLFHCIDA